MVKDTTRMSMAELQGQRLWLIDQLRKANNGWFSDQGSLVPMIIQGELGKVERAIKKSLDKCDRSDCGCSCRFCKDNSGDVIPPFCCH